MTLDVKMFDEVRVDFSLAAALTCPTWRPNHGHVKGAAMRWKIGQAKQRFSEVVRRAAVEPQLICNRERVVAAVIDPGSAERLRSIVEREGQQTIAEVFDAFREMAARERYGLKIPPRKNRRNPFPHGVDRLSRRHERPG